MKKLRYYQIFVLCTSITVICDNLISQNDTVVYLKNCSILYSKIDSTKSKIRIKVDSINNINKIDFFDTVSVLIRTTNGKKLPLYLKQLNQLSIPGQNNVGKTSAYSALIGFGTLGTIGFFSGLSETSGAAALYGLVGGTLGAGIGALIGLFIGGAGNTPDIIDLSKLLTNTEKRNRMIKFIKQINF